MTTSTETGSDGSSGPKRVLVGSTLEISSDVVVATALRLARASGAEIHLFHSFSLPVAYFAAPTGLTTFDPQVLESEAQVRRQLVGEQLDRLEVDEDAVAGVVIETGAASRMLLETARGLAADLVVIGGSESHGTSLLGSTADRILRKSPVPVLVVQRELETAPRRLLVPTDLSDLSRDCVARGLRVVEDWGGRDEEIECLFVLTEEERDSSGQFTPEQIEKLAHEEVEGVAASLREGGDAVTARVRVGEPRREILAELKEGAWDLVVLGTHGRGGFERLLLGSVASDVASRSSTSCLVVPPPHDGKP